MSGLTASNTYNVARIDTSSGNTNSRAPASQQRSLEPPTPFFGTAPLGPVPNVPRVLDKSDQPNKYASIVTGSGYSYKPTYTTKKKLDRGRLVDVEVLSGWVLKPN